MSLLDQLKDDLNQALRANEALKVETLRGLLAAIHNREIELRGTRSADSASVATLASPKPPAERRPVEGAAGARREGDLTEEEIILVLGKEAKKRKEAAEIYTKAGRQDLGDKEIKELEIIKAYLPPQLSEGEIEGVVKKIVDEGITDFGRVMGAVMKEVAGRTEAEVVKGVVEKVLENRQ